MKNKKIIIIIAICVLLIIAFILIKQLNKGKNKVNDIQENFVNTEENNLENKTNEINNENNNVNANTSSENKTTKTPKQLYKELLSDENWVKKNLYIKKSFFGKEIDESEKQTVTFMKLEDENFSSPIVIVNTECKKATSNQCFILTYNNGEVNVSSIYSEIGNYLHDTYNVNGRLKIISRCSVYSQSTEYQICSLSDKGAQKIYNLKLEKISPQETVYYINEKKSTKEEYENLKEQYVSETIRKENFKIISNKNLSSEFE